MDLHLIIISSIIVEIKKLKLSQNVCIYGARVNLNILLILQKTRVQHVFAFCFFPAEALDP